MSNLLQASVPIRSDVVDVELMAFEALAAPGAVLDGARRVALAEAARSGETADELQAFAHHLYTSPGTVHEEHVRAAADATSDPAVVEAIGIVARLSALDRVHDVLGVDLEPLPDPKPGEPTGEIREGLKRRRGHLPMPPGPIPVTLGLVPSEEPPFHALFGPLYMTEEEMGDPHFRRDPGLDTPQLETIAARISLLNECFY